MMGIDKGHGIWALVLACSLLGCPDQGQSDGDGTSTGDGDTGDGDGDTGDGDGDTGDGDGDAGDGDGDTGDGDGDTGDGDGDTGDGDGDGEPGSLLGAVCSPAFPSCDAGELCCSTDPAALDFADLSAFVLPAYQGKGTGDGVPIFADANNGLSSRGVCVVEGDVPESADLDGAPGCPVPCNPNWSKPDVEKICGTNTLCCQIEVLQPEDCVLDPSLGDAGCWRPATGEDIAQLSQWGVDEHATHQDPGLVSGCETLVNGLPPEHDPDEVRAACRRRLGVASERGLCLGGAQACPFAQPSYIDACEQLNLDNGLSGC